MLKNPSANAGDIEMWVRYMDQEDTLEETKATHSSILAWRILWTEEPGRLQLSHKESEATEHAQRKHCICST